MRRICVQLALEQVHLMLLVAALGHHFGFKACQWVHTPARIWGRLLQQ